MIVKITRSIVLTIPVPSAASPFILISMLFSWAMAATKQKNVKADKKNLFMCVSFGVLGNVS